ncbi:DUF1156 domain-containing protein [Gordonia alkanivorans]|uniref:DUF1156 domain-containing protein n=1 Tax=Gordonia alkanivorans NBRC 16433 TaxID=1027371 RepID=F9W258_9ACTN|nr:DUF1156 domain-containing protein [Gordonia alkanivorans]GAA14947.1 hypothetical protein GOALK_120_00050 [Gordonia alkanivorans NBRC 16433]
MVQKRKLIEVALPLEAINRESAREKSIRYGHPSTLHLWWARRPLAAARAVLFAQLVDDPSSRLAEFPTDELQRAERERLHEMIERLVVWENVRDEALLAEARAEILKSTDGNPPPILDPFAGGGAIPLEALRLGLEARASDLNPVAVLLNKAVVELPSKFAGQAPVWPGLKDSRIGGWAGGEGLAADVREYGEWVHEQARKRLGKQYPDADGLPVIGWIWARTVQCPNPACAAEVPLVSSLDLSTKRGQEVWLRPVVASGRVEFVVESGVRRGEANKRGQGAKFDCWVCGSAISPEQVHSQLDVSDKPPNRLLAVVAAGNRRRVYSEPTVPHLAAARGLVDEARRLRASDPNLGAGARGTFGGNAQGKRYGFFTFADYFTDRQLVALATFNDLVGSARAKVISDGGSDDYADAVATYLAFIQSKMTNLSSSVTTWMSDRGAFRETFARQAIPMAWDFVEANVLSDFGGGWLTLLDKEARVIEANPIGHGVATQADAASLDFDGSLVSTDPPYYDNIVYSDLADFFYVWLRRSLRGVYPELLSTMLVPKAEELVANQYRLGSKAEAKSFFEDGFRKVFASARRSARDDLPTTVYYAFKQSESDATGSASTGWETLLEGMIRSGWEITSTWPLRTEGAGRLIAKGTNALASSIVLSLRPRASDSATTDRRGFIAALEAQLPVALRRLQQGQIAPVDLPQAAIGPGMAVFSRYSAVLEPDGKRMTVRSALARINEILDQVLNEQEGDFDAPSRFAIAWYRQHGYDVGAFGDANNLANARNTTVDVMDRDGILSSRAGKVQLIKPSDLSWDYDPVTDLHTSNWEALHHLIKVLERDGIAPAGDFLQVALSRPDGAVDADLVKELAHLLFRVAEANGWTKDALSFNSLVTSWPEILEVARSARKPTQAQGAFDFDEDN